MSVPCLKCGGRLIAVARAGDDPPHCRCLVCGWVRYRDFAIRPPHKSEMLGVGCPPGHYVVGDRRPR